MPENVETTIKKTAGVSGGDACIGNTRIPVWLVVAFKRDGMSDEDILAGYPGLTAEHLAAAWDYYQHHQQEIDDAIVANETEDEDA